MVSVKTGGITLALYGQGKTGKTRIASSFPKPALIIGTEDGTGSVSTVENLSFVQIYESHELDDLLGVCKTKKYKSVIIDTAGGLQDIIQKEVCGFTDIPITKTFGDSSQEEWGMIGQQLKEWLARFLKLSKTHDMNVIIIAHERSFKPDGVRSDIVKPNISAALTEKNARWLEAAVDYIGQTYIREETEIITVENEDGSKHQSEMPTGKLQYCLRTGPHSIYRTGFRVPVDTILPDCLTFERTENAYDKIIELIRGKQVQENTKVQPKTPVKPLVKPQTQQVKK